MPGLLAIDPTQGVSLGVLLSESLGALGLREDVRNRVLPFPSYLLIIKQYIYLYRG